jgi:homoserine dehydrogenase
MERNTMSRHLDAALTSGTSPGARQCRIHLLGAGAVGQSLLRRVAHSRHVLTGVTDTTGTIAAIGGLDANTVAEWKRSGRCLAQHPDFINQSWTDTIERLDADIVIDATSSDTRDGWAAALEANVLERGRSLVLVAKSALAERAAGWLSGRYDGRIACNAVLGGTGHSFLRTLPALRASCSGVAIVGNATTTSIITALESGGSLSEGIDQARRLGFLEPDPELDLRGTDAAVKIAIVAGAIRGRVYDANGISCDDIRNLDPFVVQARARRGLTTRLVARLEAEGTAAVAYEEIQADSLLAAPCGRVVYRYDIDSGDHHIYIGEGLGADATATAAWLDVNTISRSRTSSHASLGARIPFATVSAGGAR